MGIAGGLVTGVGAVAGKAGTGGFAGVAAGVPGGMVRSGAGGRGTGGGVTTGEVPGAGNPFGAGSGLPSLVSSLITGTWTFTGPTSRSSIVRRARVSSTL